MSGDHSHLTYVTVHSPTLPLLYLCHSSISNPFVALPTSQLILQPVFCFSYVTGSSLTSPGELPMVGRCEEKRPSGRSKCRWEHNIKIDLKEMGCDARNWIDLAQDRNQWLAYVRAVIKLRVP